MHEYMLPQHIANAKEFVSAMIKYDDIPTDFCSRLDDTDWAELVTTLRNEKFLVDLPARAIALCILKEHPGTILPAKIPGVHYQRTLYECAIRKGLGTRLERGKLLEQDLGM